MTEKDTWKDLAPKIHRQRLIIEGTTLISLDVVQMGRYLRGLSEELDMAIITGPSFHESEKHGWAAWMHWSDSGCHMYTWNKPHPKFFSVDIYTCKPFSIQAAIRYTEVFFGSILNNLVWKE